MIYPRIVCQFSCGAASAVATKLMLVENPNTPLLIVNAFIEEEDDDNRRFLGDCEKWFEHPIMPLDTVNPAQVAHPGDCAVKRKNITRKRWALKARSRRAA